MPGVEVWGGVECTVNRVQDQYFDQLHWSGHARRIEDLDLFAWLGIRTLRYPILWERIAPDGLSKADWSWADERLERLHELGIRPIIGLLHHGSGPLSTSLLDPAFPEKLAEFAGAVAQRYPWIDAYTPVNEPLTTARFSSLYGLWYPHRRDDRSFARALLNQVNATKRAMHAIRQVNPQAQLVQTEDLAKTYSTPSLDYQADFDNARRWLSLDLLTGRITKKHFLYGYLTDEGISANELAELVDEPCPLDILGINYYITGERFIDEKLERYPEFAHGGNGRQRYADVEAVRVCTEGPSRVGGLITEVWQRYHLPLVVTEVHLGGTRDEQLRWLYEVWKDVNQLRQVKVDIRAITPWALLGSFNWHTLVTRNEGRYEPGAFDVRSNPPRPTALAMAVRSLAMEGSFDHPALDMPGWWRRPERLLYQPVPRRDRTPVQIEPINGDNNFPLFWVNSPFSNSKTLYSQNPRQVLITVAEGTLGRAFVRLCEERGLPYQALSHRELDISDPDQVGEALNLTST